MAEENVTISCPYCGMQYEIPPEYLGQEADCSGCAKRFVLALPEQDQAPEQMVNAVCSSCGMRYEVPVSQVGSNAECAKCGAVFTITPETQQPSAPAPAPEPEEMQQSTNTVRLSRKKVGMIPSVKDDPFKVAVVSTHTNINIPKEEVAPEEKPPEETPPQKKFRWQFWKK